jgi:hypothetical protein
MKPLFPVFQCACKQTWDPLGLHAAMCTKMNSYNLLHNSVRDCFAGAARSAVRDDSNSNVSFILTDTLAKSATWIHSYYPLKETAPAIRDRLDSTARPAPSLSPDILISFSNDPFHPYFGDFVASSPSLRNKCKHGEAAQIAYNGKLQHYSKYHVYPERVFYPLAFERSGYLHPIFIEFIDLYSSSCSPNPSPHIKLQLIFSVAFAITFSTASLLKSASRLLLPYSTQTLTAPHALPLPVRWAPQLPPPRVRPRERRAAVPSSTTHSLNTPSTTYPVDCTSSSLDAAPAHLSLISPLPAAHTSERLGARLGSGGPAVTFKVTARSSSDV